MVKTVSKGVKKAVKAVKKHVVKHVVKHVKTAVKVVAKVAKVVTKCVGGVVVSAGKCAVNTVGNAIEAIGDMFKSCWNALLKSAKNGVAKASRWAMDLVEPCSSLSKCKEQFVKGSKLMWEAAKKAFTWAVDNTVFAGPAGKKMKKAVNAMINIVKKVPKIAKGVGLAAIRAAEAFLKLFTDTAKGIKREAEGLNFDSMGTGFGLWLLKPTDCGAFSTHDGISAIFDFKKIGKIKQNFVNGFTRLGQCLIKTPILSVPIPFMDLVILRWKVPDPVQLPVKYIVGTFRYVFKQLAAAVAGCPPQHASEPICVFVKEIAEVGHLLATAFTGALLLEEVSEHMGERLHGNKAQYKVERNANGQLHANSCSADDFKLAGAYIGQLSFSTIGKGIGPGGTPNAGSDSVSIKFQLQLGCRTNSYTGLKVFFIDMMFGAGLTKFILGINVEPVEGFKTGGAFEVSWESGKQTDAIVQWGASVVYGATLKVCLPVPCYDVTFGLSLAILPEPSLPKGFSISPKLDQDSVPALLEAGHHDHPSLLQVQRQQEIEEIANMGKTDEERVYRAVGVMFHHIKNMDSYVFSSEYIMSLIRAGSFAMIKQRDEALGAAKHNQTAGSEASPYAYPSKLAMSAGIKVDFCLTCGLSAAAASLAYGAPPNVVNSQEYQR